MNITIDLIKSSFDAAIRPKATVVGVTREESIGLSSKTDF
jgi:hypothetical protein